MELSLRAIGILGRRAVDRIDPWLVTIVLILAALGLATLYSASYENPLRVRNQLGHLVLGLAAMWVAARIPPQGWMRLAAPTYVLGVCLLVAVALFGDVVNGARRWLNLGFMRFQPSEMMKIAMPLMLAWYFHRNEVAVRARDFLVALVLLALPVALIVRQPDLGTAVLVAAGGGFVIFLAGISWRWIAGAVVVGLASLPPVWGMLHDYQRMRILTLIDPTQDPLGAGYHIIQSKIAIGSGGIYGKGWLNGTQSQLEFIPERSTDFVFAVFSEEFGLLGVATLLAIYLFIVLRGLYIAINAQDPYGRLVGGSLVLTFFIYVFVNIGMVSGLLPVVGVPLPLVSYGGTSIVTIMAGFGLLMSIHTHRRLLSD